MQETMSRGRPLGVTIIAALVGIEGIVELIIGILALVAIFAVGHAVTVHGHTTTGTIVDVFGGVLGGASLLIGLITLIFAWGLWTLRRWAFWLTVIIEVITLVRHAIEFAHPHPVIGAGSIVLGLVIPAVILIYFLADSNVRAAFRT